MKSLVRLMARDFFCIAFMVPFAHYASVERISISVEVNSASVEVNSASVEANSASVESHSMKWVVVFGVHTQNTYF